MTGDLERVAECCQRSKIAGNCLTHEEPLLAELPYRDTSHSCPGCC